MEEETEARKLGGKELLSLCHVQVIVFLCLGRPEPLLPLLHTFRAGPFPSTLPPSPAQGAIEN